MLVGCAVLLVGNVVQYACNVIRLPASFSLMNR
jgi:hypothetical protein